MTQTAPAWARVQVAVTPVIPTLRRAITRAAISAGVLFFVLNNIGLSIWPPATFYFAHPKLADFSLYYRDGRIVVEHGWRSLSDPVYYVEANNEVGTHRPDPPVPSLYPPLQTAIIAPFAALPFPVAYVIWETLMLGCLILAAWLLAPRPLLSLKQTLLTALVFTPVPFGLSHGQVIFIIGAAVAGAWVLIQRDRQFLAGLLLTLILLKPNFAVLVPLTMLATGRWRVFLGFTTGVAGVGLAYLLTLPWDTLLAYISRLHSAAQHATDWYTMWDATLTSIDSPLTPVLVAAVVGAVIMIAMIARKSPQRDAYAIAAAFIGTPMIVPYLHYQDLYGLLIAAWLLLRTQVSAWFVMFLAIGYLLISSEVMGGHGQTLLFEVSFLLVVALMVRRLRATEAKAEIRSAVA